MTAPRIFDRLNGEPEDARLSRIAHQMRRGILDYGMSGPLAWWWTALVRDEPVACEGEIQS